MIYRPYTLILPLSEYRDTLSPEGYAILDITKQVTQCVTDSRVKTGQINMHTLHTTCTLAIQEYEKGLVENDFLNMFRFIAPTDNGTDEGYRHNDLVLRAKQPDPKLDLEKAECLDAHAHILGLVLSPNVTRNIENGKVLLGKWANILFIELNGHARKERIVSIHISGDANAIIQTTLTY